MFQFLPQSKFETGLQKLPPNRWDWALFPLVIGVIFAIAFGASQMSHPFNIGKAPEISLAPEFLPYYLLRTTMRMMIALFFSLLFTFTFAYLASKNRMAEKIMVPALDILQSLPIVGFEAIAITPFIALFPGNQLGVECAAIFLVFTSQAWNMAFSLYQSMRTVPTELVEASKIYQLSGWQRFWRLELPYGLPNLIWNMMMSMSGGWFFVVFAEAFSVSGQQVRLPGIGSYIELAIEQKNIPAIGMVIITMAIAILAYDQLMFRPLLAWADKFRFEENQGETAQQSWLLDWLRRSAWLNAATKNIWKIAGFGLHWFRTKHDGTSHKALKRTTPPIYQKIGDTLLATVVMLATWKIVIYIHSEVGWDEVFHVFRLGLATLSRVMVLLIIATLFWVPVGVWVGLRPLWAQKVQAFAQLAAAFPSNLIFPLVAWSILRWHLNPDIWLSPLIVLGTQWYIVFNVISGAANIPMELRNVADNYGLRGWIRWKRFILPAILPSLLTGLITASGGSWNASVLSELVSWGDTHIQAAGLGAYVAEMQNNGDFPRLALGMAIMSVFVLSLNHYVWRRLYELTEKWAR